MIKLPDHFIPIVNKYFRTNLANHPSPESLSARSWKQVLNGVEEHKKVVRLNELLDNYSFQELLPVWNEWEHQLDTTYKFTSLSKYLLHLSFSFPVLYPDLLALSSLLKLYTDDEKQVIRIKISCFISSQRKLWWEVGFVHMVKSLESDQYLRSTQPNSYYLLSALVANTYSFIRQRPAISGIHLSPAYYHIWPLSKRIATQYPSHICEKIPGDWLETLDKAYLNYCSAYSVNPLKTISQKRFHISRLLQQQRLTDAGTGELIRWKPPAVTIMNQ